MLFCLLVCQMEGHKEEIPHNCTVREALKSEEESRGGLPREKIVPSVDRMMEGDFLQIWSD